MKKFIYYCITALLTVGITVLAGDVYAQKSDPYANPALWEQLRKDPNNHALWTKYMKKPWNRMTKKDKSDIEAMKQLLYIEAIADEESIVAEKEKPKLSDIVFKDVPMPLQVVKAPKSISMPDEVKQLVNIESLIMQEPPEIEDLKTNMASNFVIIEEHFRDMFDELGEKYRYFHEVHPKGDYSQIKWIEENEIKIKLLKLRQIDALRSSFTITVR